MENEPDVIADDEILYRSVNPEHIDFEDGQMIRLSGEAFTDRVRQISFNRAKLRSAHLTRFRPDNAIVRVVARDVRAITITHNDQQHRVEVKPDPLHDNPAHAIVLGIPDLERRGFDKLKRVLKEIAALELLPETEILGNYSALLRA